MDKLYGLRRQGMTGLGAARTTQTWPGAKFIGSPAAVVKTVPSFSESRYHSALNAWPSRSTTALPLPVVCIRGV